MKKWTCRARVIVSGLVQGVGYRYFVLRKAKEYHLTGYVRNLYSDDVEVLVEGDEAVVRDFIKELRVGPMSANVTGVQVKWEEGESEYEDFEVRF